MNEEAFNTAVLGGGCFWCMEAVYKDIPGIHSVESGYAAGSVPTPSYEEVCTGRTGHAEVVRITYDPRIISYRQIVDLFWKAHDPTTLNRQGADTGTQYRSIILHHSEDEKLQAEASRAAAAADFSRPIVTAIQPIDIFYPAERHHQNFYAANPAHPYNAAVIRPKLDKLKRTGVI